ncbi:hypothetical protein NEDG_02181 [Nematocida displodere]|uniref:Uncharacterized protein n=1 Tax=Nematocida displodere TaxID=1805483 RepID=A0A177ENL9_9MICR|nr:hypothetical protein NEDG_02181 [Nematocida displodere]
MKAILCLLLALRLPRKRLWAYVLVLAAPANVFSAGVDTSRLLGNYHLRDPDVFERADDTDQTIEFFRKCNIPLKIKNVGTSRFIIKKQQMSTTRKIYIREYMVEEIPDTIKPEIQLYDLHIYGDEISSTLPMGGKDVILRLAKLLYALGDTNINEVLLGVFDVEYGLDFGLAFTGLCVYSISVHLVLHQVSASFVRWLGAKYNFAQPRAPMGLKLQDSPDITSLVCLDALNFTEVYGLWINDLKNLQDLDCRLLKGKHVTKSLMVTGLGKLSITPNIAQAIANKNWEGIYMDISFWMAIFSAQPDIYITGLLLPIKTMEEVYMLGNRLKTTPPLICVGDLTITATCQAIELTQQLVKLILGWLNRYFKELCRLTIVALKPTSAELVSFLETNIPTCMPSLSLKIFQLEHYNLPPLRPLYPLTTNVITISYPGVPEYDGGENENEEATTLL